ncbi:MAG TPA: tRNA lysidine(34) synthetase TilS [Verrucomicrobiae bacterium]
MDKLVTKVRKNIQSHGLIQKGEAVLVAVSGGVDSMVLLDVLRQLAETDGFTILVVHFNHQLRGRAANLDEKLVQKYCVKHGVLFEAGRGDVRGLAKEKKISIEMAARELRLDFLSLVAEELRCNRVAVAHHADDQVELFFIRLFRGSGGDGLGGMEWERAFPGEESGLRLVRPLLDLDKAELLQYAKQHAVPYREDATNKDTKIFRNRIRQKLVPEIRTLFGEGVMPAIIRTMEVTSAEADLVAVEAKAWVGSAKRKLAFCKLHVAVQRQIIQQQLWSLQVAESFELIEELRTAQDVIVQVDKLTFLCRRPDGTVEKSGPKALDFNANGLEVAMVNPSGTVLFASLAITWEKEEIVGEFKRPKSSIGMEVFDVEKVGDIVRLRHWQAGDRFQPLGMAESVKLQDWFVNQKIPAERRRKLVVAEAADGRIFWVEGLRIGEQFKLDKASRQRLKWQWQAVSPR